MQWSEWNGVECSGVESGEAWGEVEWSGHLAGSVESLATWLAALSHGYTQRSLNAHSTLHSRLTEMCKKHSILLESASFIF